MSVNLSRMLKADLIKLVEEKDAKIKKLEKEVEKLKSKTGDQQSSRSKKQNNSNTYDNEFFEQALAVLENYGIGEEPEDKMPAKDLIESLRKLPKRKVHRKIEIAIQDTLSQGDVIDFDMDTAAIMDEIFDDELFGKGE